MTLRMNARVSLGAAKSDTPVRRGARGVPLPEEVLRDAEQLFGQDFSDVRVHVGPEAARMGALAFTVGTRIYFAPGRYDPSTPEGRRLLGHELAHVLQQRSGRAKNRLGYGIHVLHDEALEAEADRMGAAFARGPDGAGVAE